LTADIDRIINGGVGEREGAVNGLRTFFEQLNRTELTRCVQRRTQHGPRERLEPVNALVADSQRLLRGCQNVKARGGLHRALNDFRNVSREMFAVVENQ
jgi:hypothetical protein